jgi:uncharacterized Fe-S center protein
MKQRKTLFRLIAKALGEKASKCDRESDKVAIIRIVMFLSIFLTNCFIVAGVVRNWNKNTQVNVKVYLTESNVRSYLSSQEKERILKTNRKFEYD